MRSPGVARAPSFREVLVPASFLMSDDEISLEEFFSSSDEILDTWVFTRRFPDVDIGPPELVGSFGRINRLWYVLYDDHQHASLIFVVKHEPEPQQAELGHQKHSAEGRCPCVASHAQEVATRHEPEPREADPGYQKQTEPYGHRSRAVEAARIATSASEPEPREADPGYQKQAAKGRAECVTFADDTLDIRDFRRERATRRAEQAAFRREAKNRLKTNKPKQKKKKQDKLDLTGFGHPPLVSTQDSVRTGLAWDFHLAYLRLSNHDIAIPAGASGWSVESVPAISPPRSASASVPDCGFGRAKPFVRGNIHKRARDQPKEKNARRKQRPSCTNCQEHGHVADQCLVDRLCRCCSSRSHVAHECPRRNDRCESCGHYGHAYVRCVIHNRRRPWYSVPVDKRNKAFGRDRAPNWIPRLPDTPLVVEEVGQTGLALHAGRASSPQATDDDELIPPLSSLAVSPPGFPSVPPAQQSLSQMVADYEDYVQAILATPTVDPYLPSVVGNCEELAAEDEVCDEAAEAVPDTTPVVTAVQPLVVLGVAPCSAGRLAEPIVRAANIICRAWRDLRTRSKPAEDVEADDDELTTSDDGSDEAEAPGPTNGEVWSYTFTYNPYSATTTHFDSPYPKDYLEVDFGGSPFCGFTAVDCCAGVEPSLKKYHQRIGLEWGDGDGNFQSYDQARWANVVDGAARPAQIADYANSLGFNLAVFQDSDDKARLVQEYARRSRWIVLIHKSEGVGHYVAAVQPVFEATRVKLDIPERVRVGNGCWPSWYRLSHIRTIHDTEKRDTRPVEMRRDPVVAYDAIAVVKVRRSNGWVDSTWFTSHTDEVPLEFGTFLLPGIGDQYAGSIDSACDKPVKGCLFVYLELFNSALRECRAAVANGFTVKSALLSFSQRRLQLPQLHARAWEHTKRLLKIVMSDCEVDRVEVGPREAFRHPSGQVWVPEKVRSNFRINQNAHLVGFGDDGAIVIGSNPEEAAGFDRELCNYVKRVRLRRSRRPTLVARAPLGAIYSSRGWLGPGCYPVKDDLGVLLAFVIRSMSKLPRRIRNRDPHSIPPEMVSFVDFSKKFIDRVLRDASFDLHEPDFRAYFLDRYTAIKGAEYAKKTLEDYERMLHAQDKRLDEFGCFLKDENSAAVKDGQVSVRNRLIMTMSLRMLVECCPVIELLETWNHGPFSRFQIKGLDADVAYAKIEQQMAYDHAVTDYSSFEASVDDLVRSIEMYAIDQLCVKAGFDETRRRLQAAGAFQASRILRHDGLLFNIVSRCSGDFWTSFGNGLVNVCLMAYEYAKQGVDIYPVQEPPMVLAEGDDAIARTEGIDFTAVIEGLNELNFDLSDAQFGKTPGTTEMLRSAVLHGDRYIDIARALKVLWITSGIHLRPPKQKFLLRCAALSLYLLSPGHPVLTGIVNYILSQTRGMTRFRHSESYTRKWRWCHGFDFDHQSDLLSTERVEVNEAMRPGVAAGFGGFDPVSESEQLLLEQRFERGELYLGQILSDNDDVRCFAHSLQPLTDTVADGVKLVLDELSTSAAYSTGHHNLAFE